MAIQEPQPPPVPVKLQGVVVLVFSGIAILGAIEGNLGMVIAGGVIALAALGINRLIRMVLWRTELSFGSTSGATIEQGGDFTDPPKQLPEESEAGAPEATPTVSTTDHPPDPDA